jgi:DHA3 family macrolide efflux protein-like MFS transporter
MIGASIIALIGTLIVLASALLGHLSIWPILAGGAIASIGEAFQWPALAATLPALATEDDLPRFNGLIESGRAASMMAGPGLGGAMFVLVGLPGLLGIELATFILSMIVISVLTLPNSDDDEDEEEEPSAADLLLGFRWIRDHKPLFKLLCAGVFANFFLSIGTVLMAPYCLGLISERAYGIASGFYGGGMILGGIVYGFLAQKFNNARIFIIAVITLGLFYSAYGLARSFLALALMEFGFGILVTAANSATLTIWQRKVPEEISGRVLAAMWTIAEITTPISFLLAGPIGDSMVPWLLSHAAGPLPWIGAIWGTTKSGQLGTLFSAIGMILFVGFVITARSKDVREVEDCPI